MTPEEQRIAFAEARGWKPEKRKMYAGCRNAQGWGLNQHLSIGHRDRRFALASYNLDDPNDLTVIREASLELRRRDKLKYAMMHKELERIVAVGNSIYDDHSWATADATAGQRTEAFLKAIGRWKPTSLPQDTSRSFRAGSYGETP